MNKVLITGASGLLGRALVSRFNSEGWFVFAHYYSRKGEDSSLSRWIYGDFRSIEGVHGFLRKNSIELKECSALINNYGPLTYKETSGLTSEDILSDVHSNLIVAKEITDYMISNGDLSTVVNIGYSGVGDVRPYSKILSYAMAKAALQLLTLSYGREFQGISFSMVSPPSLEGGTYGTKKGPYAAPGTVAAEVFTRTVSGEDGV